jgi:type I restriction enzyme M protein
LLFIFYRTQIKRIERIEADFLRFNQQKFTRLLYLCLVSSSNTYTALGFLKGLCVLCAMQQENIKSLANFIWQVADLLRGEYKRAEYGKIILPFILLRRFDCVLAPTQVEVRQRNQALGDIAGKEQILNSITKVGFHNHSAFDLETLYKAPQNLKDDLNAYIQGFSSDVREIFTDHFDFVGKQIDKLNDANLLYKILEYFLGIDLHPDKISNLEMGYLFEELIRKFAEDSNETAGEHFTPREVVRLIAELIFIHDREIFKRGVIKTLYDCACGTGGMLSVAEEVVHEYNAEVKLEAFGQELNPESYAICKGDMLVKGHKPKNIRLGNSFSNDFFENERFDYMLVNPPFGVEWKKVEKEIKAEHEKAGFSGRFGAGLPRINDGSLLFLQHLISKMKQGNEGSRIGIVFNGSPLFTGGAGSGESNIRQWIIAQDLLEGIIALPDQLFYNTGISTYIWILSNKKPAHRKGKVQLVNAVSFYQKMKRSLGNKRNEISREHISQIKQIYADFQEGEFCKIFDNEDFGYSQITIEVPALDENNKPIMEKKKPKIAYNDTENVPLKEDIQAYFEREVLPHLPHARINEAKTKIGYEVNFTKYFYEYKPLRPSAEIRKEIITLQDEIKALTEKL